MPKSVKFQKIADEFRFPFEPSPMHPDDFTPAIQNDFGVKLAEREDIREFVPGKLRKLGSEDYIEQYENRGLSPIVEVRKISWD